MSPSPLGSHNHSQTHLKLSEWLPLRALVSADLQNLSELSGTWTFLSLELPKHAKASSQGQILVHAEASKEENAKLLSKNLISSLNRWVGPCSRA